MKKGQGLPLNTIIIAVLVLIVLVVLILIFTGRINIFNKGINECEGYCHSQATCDDGVTLGFYSKNCVDAANSAPSDDKPYCCPPGSG